MISLNRFGVAPDHQGKSHLCVLYSLAKALTSGFTRGKFGKVLIFDQNDVVTALLQIHKDGQMKDPINAYHKTTILVREKNFYDGQAIFLRDNEDSFWYITVFVEDATQKVLTDKDAEFLLGLDIETHCFYIKEHDPKSGQFLCLNSMGQDKNPEPTIEDTAIGPARNYPFKVSCEAKRGS